MRFYCLLFLWFSFSTIWAQSTDRDSIYAEWDSLGYTFVDLLNERNSEMDYYFASKAFWKRLIIKNPKSENVRVLNDDLLEDTKDFNISTIFGEVRDGVRYKFLHSRADSVLVVQQRLDDLEFNYLFFKLNYLEEDWKVVDIYFLIYDTYLSSLIRNTVYFPIVFEALGRSNAGVILENSKIYREAKHLYGEGETERAYLKLSGIPLEERLRDYQVYKIFLSGKVEDDRKLLRSVKEYQEKFGSTERLPLLFLDYYVVLEEYDAAIALVGRIDSIIGGDPYLNFYTGLLYYLKGDWKASGKLLEEALLFSPEEDYYVAFLMTVLVEHKAYRWAVNALDKLVKTEYYTQYELGYWVKLEYPKLARSRPFKRWLRS
ncbi:MAG: tetratricopeptide repeat protein [Aureispira sp.]